MKNKDYIEAMNNIHASEELIQKTINSAKKVNSIKNGNRVKKICAGVATALTLSVGSVGAYVAVSGNTEILKKIGINLSQNYDKNAQAIADGECYNSNTIETNGMKANAVSVALDNNKIVMEFNLNLDDEVKCGNPNLKVTSIAVKRNSDDTVIGNDLVYDVKYSGNYLDDGTYKLFEYISVSDPNLAADSFWSDIFDTEESIQFMVGFEGLYDGDDRLVINNDDTDNWMMQFDIKKPSNLNSEESNTSNEDNGSEDIVNMSNAPLQIIEFNGVTVNVMSKQKADFGNSIIIDAVQKNFNYSGDNAIQKLKFVVKDSSGNVLNIISRNQNITVSDYANGNYTTIELESISLVVDDTSDDMNYTIEVVEDENVNVSMDSIAKINSECIDQLKLGDFVLLNDANNVYPMDLLRAKGLDSEVTVDEYGVYRIDKSMADLQ